MIAHGRAPMPQDPTARMMPDTALRFGPLLTGLILFLGAAHSWQQGSPPAWSLLADRAGTRVESAAMTSGLIGNGTTRHHVRVLVTWPPGSAQSVELGAVHPSLFNYHRDEATALLDAYPAGQDIRVRVIDGRPHSDRNDRRQLLHAAVMSVLAMVVTAIGIVFMLALGPPTPPRMRPQAVGQAQAGTPGEGQAGPTG